jgi:hypothetical protein
MRAGAAMHLPGGRSSLPQALRGALPTRGGGHLSGSRRLVDGARVAGTLDQLEAYAAAGLDVPEAEGTHGRLSLAGTA